MDEVGTWATGCGCLLMALVLLVPVAVVVGGIAGLMLASGLDPFELFP